MSTPKVAPPPPPPLPPPKAPPLPGRGQPGLGSNPSYANFGPRAASAPTTTSLPRKNTTTPKMSAEWKKTPRGIAHTTLSAALGRITSSDLQTLVAQEIKALQPKDFVPKYNIAIQQGGTSRFLNVLANSLAGKHDVPYQWYQFNGSTLKLSQKAVEYNLLLEELAKALGTAPPKKLRAIRQNRNSGGALPTLFNLLHARATDVVKQYTRDVDQFNAAWKTVFGAIRPHVMSKKHPLNKAANELYKLAARNKDAFVGKTLSPKSLTNYDLTVRKGTALFAAVLKTMDGPAKAAVAANARILAVFRDRLSELGAAAQEVHTARERLQALETFVKNNNLYAFVPTLEETGLHVQPNRTDAAVPLVNEYIRITEAVLGKPRPAAPRPGTTSVKKMPPPAPPPPPPPPMRKKTTAPATAPTPAHVVTVTQRPATPRQNNLRTEWWERTVPPPPRTSAAARGAAATAAAAAMAAAAGGGVYGTRSARRVQPIQGSRRTLYLPPVSSSSAALVALPQPARGGGGGFTVAPGSSGGTSTGAATAVAALAAYLAGRMHRGRRRGGSSAARSSMSGTGSSAGSSSSSNNASGMHKATSAARRSSSTRRRR